MEHSAFCAPCCHFDSLVTKQRKRLPTLTGKQSHTCCENLYTYETLSEDRLGVQAPIVRVPPSPCLYLLIMKHRHSA